MKLLHIADLHIGRRLNEFSLLEDQRYILDQILCIAQNEAVDGVIIAGDIYDKGIPPVEAVLLLDDFLTALSGHAVSVFVISGNHDSPERLNFGSRLMAKNGLHIAGAFTGALEKAVLTDEHGRVNLYMLPFVKPPVVKQYYNTEIETYDDAVRAIMQAADIDKGERNILVAHQFVTSGMQQPERTESESASLGGLDNVDASAFDKFDYAALGHLHGPQRIGRDTVRYAGSPLKYSFSEARQHKSVTIVELGKKGDTAYRTVPLKPIRDLREVKGPIEALLQSAEKPDSGLNREDYIHAVLTDEGEIYDAMGRLRQAYPNIISLDFENSRTALSGSSRTAASGVTEKTPVELFADFYTVQNNAELNVEQAALLREVFEEAGGLR